MIYIKLISIRKKILLGAIFLVVILSVSYVVQIQKITQNSFHTQSYQKKINQLTISLENLDNQYQNLTSLEQLMPKIESLGLIKTERIAYLNLSTNQMAVK